MTSFEIYIDPVAKGRARMSRTGIAFTPKKTRDYEKTLKALLAEAMLGRKPYDGTLTVSVVFNVKRPPSVKAKARPWPNVKPDLDNLLKSLFDASNGIVWRDDAQVCSLTTEKRYAATGSIWVAVTEY